MSDWLTPKEPEWEPPAEEGTVSPDMVEEQLELQMEADMDAQETQLEAQMEVDMETQAAQLEAEMETDMPVPAVQVAPVVPPVPPVQTAPVNPPVPVVVPPAAGWQSAPPAQQAGWQRPPAYGSYTPYTSPTQPQPYTQPYAPTTYNVPQTQQQTATYNAPVPAAPEKPKRSRGTGILLGLLSLIAVVAIVVAVWLTSAQGGGNSGLGGGSNTGPGNSPSGENGGTTSNITLNVVEPAEEGLPTVEIVQKNLDSTVVIAMYDKVSSGGWPGMGGGSTEQQVGAATGIVWSKDGYIITNAHVVYNDDRGQVYSRIKVTLWNGKEYEATVVGYDTHTDLAVIKVTADDLVPAVFGKSTQLQLGERVVVLGNNASYSWSVTQGIISGLARDVYEETAFSIKCLQTDAVINPGNSGGPLLNTSGQVVGINSAKIVQEGYEGIGFSIPIEEARPILESLIKNGYVKGRVMLGITGQTVTAEGYEGFRIEKINNDSPMKNTEAKQGDIITHVNGVRVKKYAELSAELNKHADGDTVVITIMRVDTFSGSSTSKDISVKLIEAK